MFMFFSKNFVISIVFAILCSSIVFAETIDEQKFSAIELQKSADAIGKQWNSESIRSSIALYSEAAGKWEILRIYGAASECLQKAAQQLLLLGENDSALLKLKQALKFAVIADLPVEKAKSQSLLSITYRLINNEQQAKAYMETALKESYISKDSGAMAMANFSAAEYFYIKNEFEKAIEYYQKSFDLWKEAGNLHQQAEVLIYYAYVYMVLGEPMQGLSKAKEAERIFKDINESRGKKLSQIAIGHLSSAMDDKQSALEYYLEAEKDFPDDLDYLEKAALFNGLGLIYEDYGETATSLNYREKALGIFEKNKYYYGQLSTMHSLIKLNYQLQKPQQAEFYFEQAKKLSAQLKDNYFLALSYKQIGDYYFEQSADDKALEYYQHSLKISRSSGYKANDSLILDKLGMIYQRRNQLELARENFESSLKISRQILNKFSEAQTLYHLAALNNFENNTENSLEQVKKSIEITESLTANIFNSKLKSTYFSNVIDRYGLYINLLMKKSSNKDDVIEALQAAEKSRARVMLENLSLSKAHFTKDADAETLIRENELRTTLTAKADKLTDLLSRDAGKTEIAKTNSEIKDLENKLENIKAILKQKSPAYSAIKSPAPFNVGEFQRDVLDENSLVLEFSFGSQNCYLWLIGKNELKSYVLPPREEIEPKIEKLREILKEITLKQNESVEDYQNRINAADNEYQAISKSLSEQLFGQIADEISNKRLIIVPDGELRYFPVSALPVPNSNSNTPFLLNNEIIYEPSAQMLALSTKNINSSAPNTKNLLIFSDPVFRIDDARFADGENPPETAKSENTKTGQFRFVESLNNLPRLPASKDESETITNIVGKSETDVYSGFKATRETLVNLKTDDYKILHFATHALTDEERPELSGIVLSRFDEKKQPLTELVRIQDIYDLRLNADLVVLSACDTGIGKEIKGEGLMSLNNAFLQTGAKSVMASLWRVEDNATLELMKIFYRAMADEKLTPSQALRQSQIKLRENPQYKSPFYWAAFTVQGDFRNVPQISKGYGNWTYIAFLALLGLTGFFLYRRKYYSTVKP